MSKNYQKSDAYRHETSVHNFYQYILKDPSKSEQNLEKSTKKNKDGYDESILTDDEKIIQEDIIQSYKKKMEDLSKFLDINYMKFSFKINRCMLNNCYNDIYRPKIQIQSCLQKCNQGIEQADLYVDTLVDNYHTQFQECVEEAQKHTKNIMNETIQCYDLLLTNITKIQAQVQNEFSYYQ